MSKEEWIAKSIKRAERTFSLGTIMVVHEKHGDRYFLANTIAEAGCACRKLLRERLGLWWENEPQKIEDIRKPQMSKEDAEKLLSGALLKAALGEWEEYENLVRYTQRQNEFISEVEEALAAESDYAVCIIMSRASYEYEGVSFKQCESII